MPTHEDLHPVAFWDGWAHVVCATSASRWNWRIGLPSGCGSTRATVLGGAAGAAAGTVAARRGQTTDACLPNGSNLQLTLSRDMAGDAANLSFERELGKMIAYQDLAARIAAQRTNRMIRRVVQNVATAAFLPI